MKGLLLIGGQATRLYPLSKYIAKSLLPVCDRELLHYQVAALARAGVGQIVLAAGYLVEQITTFADSYKGIELIVSEELGPRGTAGAIAQAAPLLEGDAVVVLNADILCDVSIADLLRSHEAGGRPATIMGKQVEDPSRYGLLRTRAEAISGFSEKPDGALGAGPFYINAGAYVLEPEVVASIPADRPVSIERETFPQLIAQHGELTLHRHDGLWYDVGTFESYFAASFGLLARRYALGEDALWGERDDCAIFKDLVYLHKDITLGQRVDFYHRAIVMRGATIGAGCRLENTIVMPGANVGPGSTLASTIVGPGYSIDEASQVENKVLVAGEDAVAFYPVNTEAG
jgi:mannose-1-phosphate guanylyltransferase